MDKLKDEGMEHMVDTHQNLDSSQNIDSKKGLSYMEKRELDQLTKDIIALEKERDESSRIFDQKDVAYDDIKELSVAL